MIRHGVLSQLLKHDAQDVVMNMTKDFRYKEFVLYFDELEKLGIGYGMSDLVRKAEELKLEIPKFNKDGSIVWDWDYVNI